MRGRGQLTLFIILGLVLVVIAGLGIMLFQSTSGPEQSGSVDTQQAVSFVESCLEREATNALYDVGQSGGSIEGLNFEEQPWRGDAFTNGPQEVRYWYHMEECGVNPGCIRFSPPPLCEAGSCVFDGQYEGAGESIQVTTQEIIEENIVSCIGDFSSTNFELLDQEQPEVSVIFTADDVQVSLDYPLQLRNQETSELVTINDFSTSLDVDFEEAYRLARNILALQFQTQFVEENFLHFLSLYQGDPPLLPPFNDAELFGERKIWLRSDAEQQLEDEILPYLSFMQLVNAYEGYSPILETGVDDELYQNYAEGLFKYSEIILPEGNYPDHGVSFLYPFSDIYLNINDREVLKGKSLDTGNFFTKIAGVFMRQYKHTYDVAWPMVITVEDTTALGGAGFSLNFGIEANVINNLPMYPDRTITTIDQRNPSTVDPGEPTQHTDAEFSIQVVDRRDGAPLEGVQITYFCGWSYTLPKTTDSSGTWEGSLPYCAIGGHLEASIPLEYYPDQVEINNLGDDASVEIELWPYVEKEVEMYKLSAEKMYPKDMYTEPCNSLETCREPLEWDEELQYSVELSNGSTTNESCADCEAVNNTITANQYAMLLMNRMSGSIDEPVPLVGALTFGKQGESVTFDQTQELKQMVDEFNLSEEEVELIESQAEDALRFEATLENQHQILLIPGEYTMEGLLFFEGNLTIPKAKRSTGLFSSTTLPELNLPTWLQGGVSLETVSLTEEDIYSDKKLVVYVLEQHLPTTWGELEKFKPIEEYQQENNQFVFVRFEEDSE